MTQETSRALQEKIAQEAMAMLTLGGAESDVNDYEQTVRLIGKAWGLPDEAANHQLQLIGQEREAMQKIERGETALHPLPEKDILTNWSGLESLDVLEDMFETSIRLGSLDERQAIFKMAMTLMECQNFMDWIEKTPGEEAMQDFPEAVVS